MTQLFSDDEMARRAANLREGMASAGLQAVVLTSFPSIFYFSRVPLHQFGRPAALLFPLDSEPVLVASILEQRHIEHQSWPREGRYYGDHNIDNSYENPQPPLVSLIKLLRDTLKSRHLEQASIGVEDGTLPLLFYKTLQEAVPDARFVGATGWLDRLRMILSDEELALVRAADSIADAGELALLEHLGVGRTEPELTSLCRAAMLRRIAEEHADKPFVIHHWVGLGNSMSMAGHSEWATYNPTNMARPGMLLDTVFNCFLWGYWGNVERTISIGRPVGETLRAFQTMLEANEAAIKMIKPGVALADVDRACKTVFEKRGYERNFLGSGCGRSIVSYENDSRFLPLDVRLYSDVVLEANMAFSVEPMIGFKAPYRHCNTVIVTANGCEVDSSVPMDMLWVPD